MAELTKKKSPSAFLKDVDLKGISELFHNYKLDELVIEEGKTRLHLRKTPADLEKQTVMLPAMSQMAMQAPSMHAMTQPQATQEHASVSASAEAAAASDDSHKITSPIVGTFYSAPSPSSPAFVKEGDVVNPETIVCIVEAMKMMNEIKAECSGKIVKIHVKNEEAVQPGQILFSVNTA